MAVTEKELEIFHRFVEDQMGNVGTELCLEELLWLWRDANRDDVHAAIREGLTDIEAGRYRPLDEFMEEFKAKNSIA